MTALTRVTALFIAGALCLCAQRDPRGHWKGSIEVPNQSLAMEFDLDKRADGWIGSFSIPTQNATGLPLKSITVTDEKVTFHLPAGPGDPTFNGTLSDGGKVFSGDFTQGPGTFPFKFTRTGDPQVAERKASPAVAKEFAGTWEGRLEGPGLRLKLDIANTAAGSTAVLFSLDQGNAEIPVGTIEQKATKLTLVVPMVGGRYEAEINKDGSQLTGTWSQGGGSLPLTMKKSN